MGEAAFPWVGVLPGENGFHTPWPQGHSHIPGSNGSALGEEQPGSDVITVVTTPSKLRRSARHILSPLCH